MTRNVLIFLLVVLGGAGFLVGIAIAGYHTLKHMPANMPQFLAQLVTTVGGVLATNLGAVLGFSVTSERSLAPVLGPVRPYSLQTWLAVPTVPVDTQLQIAAAWVYVVGLVAAAVLWGVAHFSEQLAAVVPTLPQLTRTLLGVIVGALAVALGTGAP